jgi:signal transduction histidine kinase
VAGRLDSRIPPVLVNVDRFSLLCIFHNSHRHRWRATIVCAICACALAIQLNAAPFEHQVRRILIIYETDPSSLSFRLIDPQLRATLDEESPYLVELYTESMETSLFPDEASQQQIRETYIRKYKDRKLDLIIAAGPSPIQFMVESHGTYFKDTPVVFCGATKEEAGNPQFDSHFTGVWLIREPAKTVDAALRLLPATTHVVVVGGAGLYDRELEATVKKSLAGYERRLEITYLTDLAMPALLDRLKGLPRDTIVLYTSLERDAAGTYFPRATSLEMLTSITSAPVFVLFDTLMDHGAVGGYVSSFAGQGREAGKIASRVLGGEKPKNIPPLSGTNGFIFDWRQLHHWDVSESNIPPDATVLFRPPTDWEKYRYKIIAVLIFLAAETSLVFLLIWLIKRRSRAQQLLERQLALEEISHLNRVASMGHMAASLAHELAQPLAAILGNAQAAERLLSRPTPDLMEIRAALIDIREDDKRARAVLDNMRALFKKQSIARHEVDLNEIVTGVSRLVRKDALLRGVELRLVLSVSAPKVLGDEIPLQQVILNLINNGMDAMQSLPEARRILSVTTCIGTDTKCGMILVEDNGPGIAEKDKMKLFLPFFTTKSEGLGMGLSICRSILDSLGGRITFDNRPVGGSVFRVELPLAVKRDLFEYAS